MKRKIIILAVTTILLATLAVLAFRLFSAEPDTEPGDIPEEDQTLPVGDVTDGEDSLVFSTTDGDITVRDFYHDPVASTSYMLTLYDDPDVGSIYFTRSERSFTIIARPVSVADFRRTRPVLEAKILELLGVSQKQACLLPIFLSTVSPSREEFSGANFGLSFCYNSLPTP